MNLPRLIALSGYKGSGKDTTAHYLVQQYGFKQMSFAAPLKDMVASTYGVPREFLDSPSHKEMPLVNYPTIPTDPFTTHIHSLLKSELASGYWTPRALCILEGSIKRSVNSSFWVRSVVETILNDPYGHYVISDVRYVSEMDLLSLMIPSLSKWRISRFDSIETQDPSERDLDYYTFDHVVSNRGNEELLRTTIDSIISTYL